MRMRRFFNRCTIVSLLLLVCSVWWWVHSAKATDQLTFQRDGGTTVQVLGTDGRVMVTKASAGGDAKPSGQLSWSSSGAVNTEATSATGAKLAATSFAFNNHTSGLTLILPVWALALSFAVMPTFWVWLKWTHRGGLLLTKQKE